MEKNKNNEVEEDFTFADFLRSRKGNVVETMPQQIRPEGITFIEFLNQVEDGLADEEIKKFHLHK